MKEHIEFINRTLFTQFPANHSKTRKKYVLEDIFTRYAPTVREQLVNILATTGIGAILLASITLFLIQLAEYAG